MNLGSLRQKENPITIELKRFFTFAPTSFEHGKHPLVEFESAIFRGSPFSILFTLEVKDKTSFGMFSLKDK